ncbi:GTP cyclohydrolase II [Magnetovibrio sp. PR-2]|uniref:GTP cyclohydrolase II n=1 Tax=Magnetovibrio sp. PR-2 TaxID=3120356 RepID=UPI002FCE12E6
MPATREPASLLAVDRAVFELRRGRAVGIAAGGGAKALVMAAEGCSAEALEDIEKLAQCAPTMAITDKRAEVLGIQAPDDEAVHDVTVLSIHMDGGLDEDAVVQLADPLSEGSKAALARATASHVQTHGVHTAAIGLAKIARLLPATVVAMVDDPDSADFAGWISRRNLVMVDAGDVFQYERTAARTLGRISDARVPLEDAENTQIIAYRPQDGGLEHLAIVIGDPNAAPDPLVRIHSECFTGDLLGSLRCDCGDQLRGAIQEISKNGAGVLLYLAQEGRGIGLVNKLRAYTLQDRGLDTLDANEMLGYDADERVYLPAAEMLKDLGLKSVRLLTNNPDKVDALARFGVDVKERVEHAFPSNKHNEHYLETKKVKGGHLF